MLLYSYISFLGFFCVIISGCVYASENFTSDTSEDFAPCEEGWTYFAGKCYKIDGPVGWRNSSPCLEMGTTLASIHSKEENDFITQLSALHHIDELLIGLHDAERQYYYVWEDGSPVDYTNWIPGQPNGHDLEVCVTLKQKSSLTDIAGMWQKTGCGSNLAYICQKQTNDSLKALEPEVCSAEEGGGVRFRDSCYNIINEKMSWNDAENYCRNISNGHLVSIIDLERDAFLTSLLPQTKDRRWIGIKIQNTFYPRWSSGYSVFYDRFDEPFEKMENNKCILRWNKNIWTSILCDEKHPFICETYKGDHPALPTPSNESVCPDYSQNWKEFGGDFCYYLSEGKTLSWYDAQEECVQKGGILASIHSDEEKILRNFFKQDIKIHIGLNSMLTSGAIYLWSDGLPMNYTHWSKNEPKSSAGNCVELRTADMSWNVISCSKKSNFFCQTEKVPVSPENEEYNNEKNETRNNSTEMTPSDIDVIKNETLNTSDSSKIALNEARAMEEQNENISGSNSTLYILCAALFIFTIVFGIAIYIFRKSLKAKLDFIPRVIFKKKESTKNYETLNPDEMMLCITEEKC